MNVEANRHETPWENAEVSLTAAFNEPTTRQKAGSRNRSSVEYIPQ